VIGTSVVAKEKARWQAPQAATLSTHSISSDRTLVRLLLRLVVCLRSSSFERVPRSLKSLYKIL
jgi:hypothetical protein